jgi:hypothetical protein
MKHNHIFLAIIAMVLLFVSCDEKAETNSKANISMVKPNKNTVAKTSVLNAIQSDKFQASQRNMETEPQTVNTDKNSTIVYQIPGIYISKYLRLRIDNNLESKFYKNHSVTENHNPILNGNSNRFSNAALNIPGVRIPNYLQFKVEANQNSNRIQNQL